MLGLGIAIVVSMLLGILFLIAAFVLAKPKDETHERQLQRQEYTREDSFGGRYPRDWRR